MKGSIRFVLSSNVDLKEYFLIFAQEVQLYLPTINRVTRIFDNFFSDRLHSYTNLNLIRLWH